MDSELLIIFTKNPVLGQVKTRLAQTIGHPKALAVFRNLLAQAAKAVKGWGGDVWVFYSDYLPENDLWSDIATKSFLQEGDDLGKRMAQAFRLGLQDYQQVVLVGTDIPGISAKVVNDAFDALKQTDWVLGPTFDGGYYLVGMNRFMSSIFEDMVWSTSEVLAQTLERIKSHDQSFSLVQQLVDVDDEDDLKRFPWLMNSRAR